MNWMKRTALAVAAGAALALSAASPSSAAPIGQAAGEAVAQPGSNLIEVRDGYRGRGHYGHWRGRRYGHWRHHHHGGLPWALFAAPFYDPYYYDGYSRRHYRHRYYRYY